jgi:hypothetical protein
VLLLILSCAKNENNMFVSGTVKGLKKGKIILLKAQDTSLVGIDTLVVNGDATFSFTETVESPELYFLQLHIENETLKDKLLSFFAEPGEINVTTSLENFTTTAVITGSKNQEKFEEYRKLMRRYTDRNLDLIEEELSAVRDSNDSLREAIQKKRNSTTTGRYLATVNFAMNNNDYELAPYLMLSEVYDANVKYLDTVYTSLTPKIKDSKYGKALESYIVEIKKSEN